MKYTDEETISKKNRSGFDPFHRSAKQGHLEIVQMLLDQNPGLSKTRGPSNATPLISAAHGGHMAVLPDKDMHVAIVKALVHKDPQLGRQMDNNGQTAMHRAAKGVNSEIVNELLQVPCTNVNALTRDHKTALDIAKMLPLSAESSDIKERLLHYGAVRAKFLYQSKPSEELTKTVTQLTNEVKKIHQGGINNGTMFFATIAFVSLFAVPSGLTVMEQPWRSDYVGKNKGKNRKTACASDDNYLMQLASASTLVAFTASSYIMVGRKDKGTALLVTIVGGWTITMFLVIVIFHAVISKWDDRMRKTMHAT
ncbi:hypothetical protein LguiA_035026 [Lonicera macranthoides]